MSYPARAEGFGKFAYLIFCTPFDMELFQNEVSILGIFPLKWYEFFIDRSAHASSSNRSAIFHYFFFNSPKERSRLKIDTRLPEYQFIHWMYKVYKKRKCFWFTPLSLSLSLYLSIYLSIYISKVGDHSRGWPESSLFDSYYTKV